MTNPIRFFLFPITTLILVNCGDNLFKDLYPGELSAEEKVWLNDDDGDGIADSLDKYAKDCGDPIKVCLKAAQENKEKEEARVLDSLKLAKVNFTLPDSTYKEVIQVEITTECDGVIRYTTNGTAPSEKSAVYVGPIPITATTVLKARTFSKSNKAGPVKSAEYELKVKRPTATQKEGTYTEPVKITLACETDETAIFYTLDGSKPSILSTKFGDNLELKNTTTIKALAVRERWTPSDILEVHYNIHIPGTVVGPVFTPKADTYHASQEVSITSETEGAEIRYTLDGTAPDSSSTQYSKKITVDSTMTIKAVAIKKGMKTSAAASAKFILKPSKPEFAPSSGDYGRKQSVTITVQSPADAEVYYTTDGQVPGGNSNKYKDAIVINKSLTVKARAFCKNWEPSEISEEQYIIKIPGEVSAPVFSPAGGFFYDSVLVEISTKEIAAKIYYTTNGHVPLASDSLFESGFTIYNSRTIMAITVAQNGKASDVSEVKFVKETLPPDTSGPDSALLNSAPVFNKLDPQSVDENKELSFTISASDANGDDLAYSMLTPSIPGAAFDAGTNTFSWTPTYAGAGNYVAKFEVTDGAQHPGRDTLVVSITVNDVNIDSLVVRNLLDMNGFASLPIDGMCEYANGRILGLYLTRGRLNGQLTVLPAEIQYLSQLRKLVLDSNKLDSLPSSVGNMAKLEIFSAIGNRLISIPDKMGDLVNLTHLNIQDNQLSGLPPSIGNLVNLTYLNIKNNQLSGLPPSFGNLVSLSRLWLNNNQLSSLPPSIGNLSKLKWLYAVDNKLTSLPDKFGNLDSLIELYVANNQLSSLPPDIVNLTNLTKIYVNNNKLCDLSESVIKWIDTCSIKPDWQSTQACPPN